MTLFSNPCAYFENGKYLKMSKTRTFLSTFKKKAQALFKDKRNRNLTDTDSCRIDFLRN